MQVGFCGGEVEVVLLPSAGQRDVEVLTAEVIAAHDVAGVGGDALAGVDGGRVTQRGVRGDVAGGQTHQRIRVTPNAETVSDPSAATSRMIQRCPFLTQVRSPLRQPAALLRVVIQSPAEAFSPSPRVTVRPTWRRVEASRSARARLLRSATRVLVGGEGGRCHGPQRGRSARLVGHVGGRGVGPTWTRWWSR